MKKGVTLKDLADKLNMSISTVSKALSNDLSISKPTSERVKALAKEWEYIPNEAARHFKLNKSYTLGLIIPDLLDQYYGIAINGVEELAGQYQYNVIVSQSHEDPEKESRIIDIMIRNRVDGVIVAITKQTHDTTPFKKLMNNGIPVVFFARIPNHLAFDAVSSDNEEGARKAVEFLLKGHKRIAHLMGPGSMPVSYQRLQGYKLALLNADIPYDPALVEEINFTAASTCAAIGRLLQLSEPPTAIFVFKNYVSLDVISCLKKVYNKEPGSIELVGFGNLPLLQYLDHKLSASIEENSFGIGVEAARLIFENINRQETGQEHIIRHIKVPCELIIHDS